MKKMKRTPFLKQLKSLGLYFENIVDQPCFYIYSDLPYAETGFSIDATIHQKLEFYQNADLYMTFIALLMDKLNETIVYAGSFNNDSSFYQKWKGLKHYDCFRFFQSTFQNYSIYQLSFPDDKILLNTILENGFRDFSNMQLFLPQSKTIIKFDCHMQIILFPKNFSSMEPTLKNLLKNDPHLRLTKS